MKIDTNKLLNFLTSSPLYSIRTMTDYSSTFYDNAIRGEIQTAIVNSKANACPMAVRLAWHASGTFDKNNKDDNNDVIKDPSDGESDDKGRSKSGGSDGATMRFEPELTDGANAGLDMMQSMLLSVKQKFPTLSTADIWTLAGALAVKLTGGPDVPFMYGRSDASDSSECPPNGRLPDASQGAGHLRDVFYRMGFNDQEIVVLSGAHTLGRCHKTRSGFDGPWTSNPLSFDNEYFKNLLGRNWIPREWDGPLQYMDDATGELMMLPTDLALIEDKEFLPWVELYASDEQKFKDDFATAFGKLLSLGCPAHCQPGSKPLKSGGSSIDSTANKEYRDHAMHGSIERMKEIVIAGAEDDDKVDPNSQEPNSSRTAMHKASFWGHAHIISYLAEDCAAFVNVKDSNGDTPLHDAARFGHVNCVQVLLDNDCDVNVTNNDGLTAFDVAKKCDQTKVKKKKKKVNNPCFLC